MLAMITHGFILSTITCIFAVCTHDLFQHRHFILLAFTALLSVLQGLQQLLLFSINKAVRKHELTGVTWRLTTAEVGSALRDQVNISHLLAIFSWLSKTTTAESLCQSYCTQL